MSKIGAVVVTYNRKELLQVCVEKLLAQEKECDVYVIDNASTDGTKAMIEERFSVPAVHYINTGANLGGAGGFEYGVKRAVEDGCQYIWIMDDDTHPTKTALSELLKAGEKLNGNWGFLSSVAYWTDGSICKMNIQKRDIFRHIGSKEYAMDIAPVKMCSFVSLLVKAEVIREVGLPIGEYFIWTDDYEFTGRISGKYPCYMVPKSKVVHAMKNHMRVNLAKEEAERIGRYHYIYRNDVHCYRQYGVTGWLYIILKNAYTIMDILLHSREEKLNKIKILFLGFKEGLTFHPVVKKFGGH